MWIRTVGACAQGVRYGGEEEHLAAGERGRGKLGKGWLRPHAGNRRRFLAFRQERLKLETMGDPGEDLAGRVEGALQEVAARGRGGKTLHAMVESLRAFCRWATRRGLLAGDPLTGIKRIDKTPGKVRRALTPDEMERLLAVAPVHRRLLYATGFFRAQKGSGGAFPLCSCCARFSSLSCRQAWSSPSPS